MLKILIYTVASLLPLAVALGGEPQKSPAVPQETTAIEAKHSAPESTPERASATQHSIKIHGEELHYTATAGSMHIKDPASEQEGDIFYVSYVRGGGGGETRRPITFAFNGGPGASSVWLHMGALGPKRVPLPDTGKPAPPPYQLVDNEYTWLDLTDLVFIDPVGTGYSVTEPPKGSGQKDQKLFGVEQDVRLVGEFIRRYSTRCNRWNSPKFLAGESYGSVRAVLLAKGLLEDYGMGINGLMLISPVLDFQTLMFQSGNDLPHVMFLPSYAATAFYHHRTNSGGQKTLQDVLADAERWSLKDYMVALARGDALTADERDQMVGKLSSLTGLTKDFIDRNEGRVSNADFTSELLGSTHRYVGLLDGRYTGAAPAENPFFDDPTIVSTVGSYVSVVNDYIRQELRYEDDHPYVYLSRQVNRSWDWNRGRQGYLNVTGVLGSVMRKTKYLKVYIACGYYDLDAPYFGVKYTVNHLGLGGALRQNVTIGFYEAGHQMYTDQPSLKKLREDVVEFIKSTFQPVQEKE